MAQNRKVAAVCKVRDHTADLLPHWLGHYHGLGIEEFFLEVVEPANEQTISQIRQCAAKWQLSTNSPAADGWFIDAELEEFHEFPAPIPVVIAACEAARINAVHGRVVDHVARDGVFPQLRPTPSVWEQFPFGCRLSECLWPKSTPKVMLRKAGADAPSQAIPIGRKEQYLVHRFGWFGDCLGKLERELENREFRVRVEWYFVSLGLHHARLNLLHPDLAVRQIFSPSPGTPGEGWGEGIKSSFQALTLTLSRRTGRGDKILLLRCDAKARDELREFGFQGDSVISQNGIDRFLDRWTSGTDLTLWLDRLRNEAAIAGNPATIWMPSLPSELETAIRRAAGNDLLEITAATSDEAMRQIETHSMQKRPKLIYAICAIRDGGADLLPHWLEHYSALGVDRLVLATIHPTDDCAEQTIQDCHRRWQFERLAMPAEANGELDQDELRRTVLRRAGARVGDWILHTDLDEFHQFPTSLRRIIAACDEQGIDAIVSRFTDRIARDGTLAPIQSTPSIWKQFPVACRMSEAICHKYVQKAMLSHFEVRTTAGHHGVSTPCRAGIPIGRPEQYRVNHFRWHAEAASRLKWILSLPGVDPHWKKEASRVLEWFDSNGGKINMNDPQLEARLAGSPFEPAANIVAVCSISNANADLLPHWLEHYTGLGVTRVLLTTPETCEVRTEEIIAKAARRFRFERVGSQADVESLLRTAGVSDDDWILHADPHEFHEFPAPLPQIIARANAKKITGIFRGPLVDHLAASGRMPNVRQRPSIFEQFPYVCRLTHRVHGPVSEKLILGKLGVSSRRGSPPLGRQWQYVTHSFRWYGEIVNDLQRMLEEDNGRQGIKWFFEHVRLNTGRINLNEFDAKFMGTAGSTGAGKRLPYIGDRVVLLHCDSETRDELRARGLQGDSVAGHDGVDLFLSLLKGYSKDEVPARLSPWIARLRNDAAIAGAIPTIWMPAISDSIAAAVRQIAGVDLLEITATSPMEAVDQIELLARPRPESGQTVFAVCTIRNGSVNLLPHWLEHYSKLGADRLLIAVVEPIDELYEKDIARCADRWTFERFSATKAMVQDTALDDLHRTILRQAGAQPEDWVLHTDLDELHEFPAPLRQIIATAAKRGIDAIVGNFLDRVALDGTLAAIQPTPRLWEQFPVGCQITKNLSRGATQKIMAARFKVHSSSGHHVPISTKTTSILAGSTDQYIVHHFKWHHELAGRLRWGMAQPGVCPTWTSEAKRLLEWIDGNGGKIDLSDTRLESKEHWFPAGTEIDSDATMPLPWLGDRVVLLRAEKRVLENLSAMGAIIGEPEFLEKLPAGDGVNHNQLTVLLGPWIASIRNRAAARDGVCVISLAGISPAVQNAIRHVAGESLIDIEAADSADCVRQLQTHAADMPVTDGKVFVVGSAGAHEADLLPHWLEHYSKLQVDRILLAYGNDANLKRTIDQCAAKWKFEAFPIATAKAPCNAQDETHRTLLRRAGATANTWVIHANASEFHQYPAPVQTVIAAAEEDRIDTVFGQITDHVAADGSARPVLADEVIWEQFPMGCRVFTGIGGGMKQRLMLAKFGVRAEHGHQTAPDGKSGVPPVGQADQFEIRQFAWHDQAIAHLQWTAAQSDIDPYWKTLASRILGHLAANGGKFNFIDPAMETEEAWHPSRMLYFGIEKFRLPYIGDRLLRLNCPDQVVQELRTLGLRVAENSNLNRLRNEAAMTGTIAGVLASRTEFAEGMIDITAQSVDEAIQTIQPHARPAPGNVGNVWAVSLLPAAMPLALAHWLEHCTALGMDRTIAIRTTQGEAAIDRILDQCAERWQFEVLQLGRGSEEELVRTALRQSGATPATWVLHGAMTDLHEFPAPIREIISAADAIGIKGIFGTVVDRVAADGSLPPIFPTPSLWEQFPMSCQLTKNIAHGSAERAMLCRFEVRAEIARQSATNAGIGSAPVGTPLQYFVHQFAWHSEAKNQLERALTQPNLDSQRKKEIQSILVWLRQQGGKINLKHPVLQTKSLVKPRLAA
jgi:inorganic pyrophosphatase